MKGELLRRAARAWLHRSRAAAFCSPSPRAGIRKVPESWTFLSARSRSNARTIRRRAKPPECANFPWFNFESAPPDPRASSRFVRVSYTCIYIRCRANTLLPRETCLLARRFCVFRYRVGLRNEMDELIFLCFGRVVFCSVMDIDIAMTFVQKSKHHFFQERYLRNSELNYCFSNR